MRNKIIPNYVGIVDVAQHCDKTKLTIAENNAFDYDLQCIYLDYYKYVKDLPSTDKVFVGGELNGLNFGGLNKIVSLFSYARYVEGSIYVDTGSGLVRKSHSNSIPFQSKEVQDLASQHRRMANIELDRLQAYLCSVNSPSVCICNKDICDKKGKTYMINNKGRNIKKTNDLLNY